MTWCRQEAQTPFNRKIAPLSDAAFRLYITARDYSVFQNTDGFIASVMIPRLPAAPRGKKLERVIGELTAVQAGEQHPLWEHAEGGYVVHDFHVYNFSREEIGERQAEKHAAKVAAGKTRAAQAARSGGRFVAGQQNQQSDQQPPAEGPATSPAATSIVLDLDTSKREKSLSSVGEDAGGDQHEPAASLAGVGTDIIERAGELYPTTDPWIAIGAVIWERVKQGPPPLSWLNPILELRARGEPAWRVFAGLRTFVTSVEQPFVTTFVARFKDYAPPRRGPVAVVVRERQPTPEEEAERAAEVERMRAIANDLPFMRSVEG